MKLIRFKDSGKNRLELFNTSNELIGEIYLYDKWRRFVFHPVGHAFLDDRILEEIIIKLEKLNGFTK